MQTVITLLFSLGLISSEPKESEYYIQFDTVKLQLIKSSENAMGCETHFFSNMDVLRFMPSKIDQTNIPKLMKINREEQANGKTIYWFKICKA